MVTMTERKLGDDFSASAVSFGAMGMSEFYGTPPDEATSLAVLDRALELGVSMIDTADMYGRGHNELLIGKFIARHPEAYVKGYIRIATKFGLDRDPYDEYKRSVNNSPEYIRASCEKSLKRLGIERIDLYYVHRINPEADLEATMQTLSDLKKEGKIKTVGLCEVSAETLRKAHAFHPIAAVQSEYSLWTRDMEASIIPTCRELGIGFVAYSPLGRGFLTGKYTTKNDFETTDFRLANPRFQEENLKKNRELLTTIEEISQKYGYTLAQTALVWLLRRYEHLVAIPGTRTISRLEENCKAVSLVLSEEDIHLLNTVFTAEAIHGERYTQEGMKGANA